MEILLRAAVGIGKNGCFLANMVVTPDSIFFAEDRGAFRTPPQTGGGGG
jgi:hypothetical protein